MCAKMRPISVFLLTLLGVSSAFGQSLSDINSQQRCDLCRVFADSLRLMIRLDTPQSDMRDRVVGRCETLLERNSMHSLFGLCNDFYHNYFNVLWQSAQNPDATSHGLCQFLCSSLARTQSNKPHTNSHKEELYTNSQKNHLQLTDFKMESDRRFEQNIDIAKRPPTISTQCSACRMVASEVIKSIKNKVSNDVEVIRQGSISICKSRSFQLQPYRRACHTMCDCEVISTDNVYDMLSHAAVEENPTADEFCEMLGLCDTGPPAHLHHNAMEEMLSIFPLGNGDK